MANANSNVANLHAMNRTKLADQGRRDRAITGATHQMEAIFGMLLVCVQHERGEIPKWPIDSEALPEVIRALAIRGGALNHALMAAQVNEIEIEDLEGRVSHG